MDSRPREDDDLDARAGARPEAVQEGAQRIVELAGAIAETETEVAGVHEQIAPERRVHDEGC